MPVSAYMPDVVVEIAFDSGYLTPAASRTWTDVSAYVEASSRISISRGRPDQFSTAQPSRLSLTLDNKDGRFTPENAAGAYYPNVKKGRPIRVRIPALASDSFNRANSAVALGTADTGGTWTALSGTWGISSNQAYCVTATDSNSAGLPVTATDVVVSANMTVAGGAGSYEGLIARATNASNYYLADVSETGQVRLFKQVAGVFTQLGSTTAAGTMSAGQVLALSCQGATISAIANGVTVISQVDTALTTSTYAGVRNGGSSSAKRWDNFTVSTSGVTSTRFTGYIDEWPVEWPTGTESYSAVSISATSRMARLGKSAELKSIVEEEILADGAGLYYPLGEPSGATTAGNVAPGRSDVLTATQIGTGGTLTFGQGTGPGTDDLSAPVLTPAGTGNGVLLAGTLAAPIATTETIVDVEMFLNTSVVALAGVFRLQSWTFGTSPAVGEGSNIGLNISATGQPQFFFSHASGATFATVTSGTNVADGLTHHVAGRVTLSGGNATASIIVDGGSRTSGASSAYAPTSFPTLSVMFLGATQSLNNGLASMFSGTVAHLSVSATSSATSDARIQAHANAGLNGFNTEASGARVARYARLAGIPTAEVSVETGLSTAIAHKDTTGDSPLSLMEAVAQTEDGVLFDAGDGTLTFHARSHRYGATSAFTLNCNAGDIEAGLMPRLDDQNLSNDVTASRPNGVTIRSTNPASITEYGYYRETVEILTTSDNEVQSRADWQVNRFGTPRVTIPDVSVDLITCASGLITSLLAAEVGTRFTLSNLPSQAPATTQDFFIEGISEEIGHESYRISFNTSAADYANVWTLDSASFSQLDSTTVLAY